ncbi:hypothetical protein MP228_006102 [Amoeboaphelidium protococcarum]|nr:hypothetical protein MP228_006102 [Amoeboaphelidium protococcarum]
MQILQLNGDIMLVPYTREHVPAYHQWMQDPILRGNLPDTRPLINLIQLKTVEQTASEPLTLDEEYEMQQKWRLDDDKLTFIIMHRDNTLKVQNESARFNYGNMIGDVNIFLHKDQRDEGSSADNANQEDQVGEIEIMIAESAARKRGIGRLCVQMMLLYAWRNLQVKRVMAKVGENNLGSLALFRNLGFTQCAYTKVFEEYTFELSLTEDVIKDYPQYQNLRYSEILGIVDNK